MDLRRYLPSEIFSSLLGAFIIAGGLITAALYTDPRFHAHVAAIYAAQAAAVDLSSANPEWEQQFEGDTTPQDMAAIQNQANQLTNALQGKNLTDSLAKSIAVQTIALQGQGIAGSASSQSELVNQILSQTSAAQGATTPAYAQTDVVVGSNTKDALRAYGNTLPKVIASHPQASESAVFLPVANAVDHDSGTPLAQLATSAREYRALAKAIIKLPTPPIFAPAAMQLANDYVAMAATIEDMQKLHDDPVRGLLGLQNFKSISNQNISILLQVGSSLKNSGIVYGTNEPGHTWSVFADTIAAVNAQRSAQSSNN